MSVRVTHNLAVFHTQGRGIWRCWFRCLRRLNLRTNNSQGRSSLTSCVQRQTAPSGVLVRVQKGGSKQTNEQTGKIPLSQSMQEVSHTQDGDRRFAASWKQSLTDDFGALLSANVLQERRTQESGCGLKSKAKASGTRLHVVRKVCVWEDCYKRERAGGNHTFIEAKSHSLPAE